MQVKEDKENQHSNCPKITVKALDWSKLEHLQIPCSFVTLNHLKDIFFKSQVFRLKSLNLASNFLTDEICLVLAKFLSQKSILKALNLSRNKLSDLGAVEIAKSIAFKTVLEKLDLTGNNLTEITHLAFSKVLLRNQTLYFLRLGNINTGFCKNFGHLKQMTKFSKRLSHLYQNKTSNDMHADVDVSNLTSTKNRVQLMSLIQNNEKALLKGCVLRKQIIEQNGKVKKLNMKKENIEKETLKEIRQFKLKKALEIDDNLFQEIKKVDTYQALQRLNQQLDAKAKDNHKMIRQKKKQMQVLKDDLNQTKKLLDVVVLQHKKLKRDEALITNLNDNIIKISEEKDKLAKNGLTVLDDSQELNKLQQVEVVGQRYDVEHLPETPSKCGASEIPAKKKVSTTFFQKSPELVTPVKAVKLGSPSKVISPLFRNASQSKDPIIAVKRESPKVEKRKKQVDSSTSQDLRKRSINFHDKANLQDASEQKEDMSEENLRETLLRGESFSYREKYSLFWKTPRFMWVTEDLNFLCIAKGTSKDDPLFISKYWINYVILKDSSLEAKNLSDDRRQSIASAMSAKSTGSTSSFHKLNRFASSIKTTAKQRTIRLTLMEFKDLIPNEELTPRDFKTKKILLKASSEKVKHDWSMALSWWLKCRTNQLKPPQAILRTYNRGLLPSASLNNGEVTGFYLSILGREDPLCCDEIDRIRIREEVELVISKAYNATNSKAESLGSDDRQSLNVTYKQVREEVQKMLVVTFEGDKWKSWFRYEIDKCLAKYEDNSEDDNDL